MSDYCHFFGHDMTFREYSCNAFVEKEYFCRQCGKSEPQIKTEKNKQTAGKIEDIRCASTGPQYFTITVK